MSERENGDLLIVGAGPIGLLCSWLLAKQGLRSTIVERYPSHLRAPKAHVINPRSLEIFRAAGLDVEHIRSLRTRPKDSGFVRFTASLAGPEYGAVPFERQDAGVLQYTPTPLINVPQPYLEDYLEGLVATQPLITLRREHTWRGVEQVAGRCHSAIDAPTGSYVFDSRYVLACDGAGSSVREALHIQMQGESQVQSCLTVHFRANLRKVVADRTGIIYWAINPKAAGAFVAHDIDDNWVFLRFDGLVRETNSMPTSAEAKALVLAAIGAEVDVEILRMAPWVMTAEVATQFRQGNVFLVGDAAHRFPPNGGLGMNTGIQDAHNLAWKLAAVAAGWAGPELLDSYHAERRRVAKANSDQSLSNALTGPRLIKALVDAGQYMGTQLPSAVRAEVEAAIRANAVTFDCLGLHLGFSYDPAQPLPPAPDVYIPRAAVGDRMPHAWLGTSQRSTLDLLAPDRFTLFTAGADARFESEAIRALAPVPVALVAAAPDQGFTAEWLELTGLARPGLLLVRPDGHILSKAAGCDARSLARVRGELSAYCDRAESAVAANSERSSMHVVSFVIPLTSEKIEAARTLLRELNESHLSGLAQRARAIGYHKEVMTLHTGETGNYLAVHLEFDDARAQAELDQRIRAYPPTDFTRWWGERFRALGPRLGHASELFTWIDENRGPQQRGEKIAGMTLRLLDEKSAAALRKLVGELKESHFDGLIERARQVGYYKESMHLQRVPEGEMLIVFLEQVGGDLRKRIQEYPDTSFTRWWNPQFRGLLGGALRGQADRVETLLDWEA